jgi:hypothetical protein
MSIFSQIAHDDVDGNGYSNGSYKGCSLGQLEVDSLAIDASHEKPIGSKSDGPKHHHLSGSLGNWQAVNPPFDEQKFQEVDEQ